jgi:hypothetical protein
MEDRTKHMQIESNMPQTAEIISVNGDKIQKRTAQSDIALLGVFAEM